LYYYRSKAAVVKVLLKSLHLALIVILLFILPVGCRVAAQFSGDGAGDVYSGWHGSTHQAPDANSNEAVIQVYSARAAKWRGALGVHTWMAVKHTDDRQYTRLEVIGYRVYSGGRAVQLREGSPDSRWYGNKPFLLREIRGDGRVDELIDRLYEAALNYPYDNTYHVWPGPNSNTFTAYLARRVPELRLELPANAIGKDYLPGGSIAAGTPSRTGVQVSLGGYLGVLASAEEGFEINVLGLTAGIDFYPPALKLPGIGRLGFSDLRRRVLTMPERGKPDTAVEYKRMSPERLPVQAPNS